ncbi:MAG: hypothetical protein AB7Q27_17555 [Acidimicrobiia bacterium]
MPRRTVIMVALIACLASLLASCSDSTPFTPETSTTGLGASTSDESTPSIATTESASTDSSTQTTTGTRSSSGKPASAISTPPTRLTPPARTVPPVNNVRAIRFGWQYFVDPAANGVAAINVLVPEGWQASGSVQWLPTWARIAFLQTRVSDPNSGITIDWLPIQNFISFPVPAGFDVPIGGNYQGKAFVPPITDPAEFVRQFWMPDDLAELQGAQLVSVTEIPETAQEFLTQFGGPGEAHAYRLRYSYLLNGRPWERDVWLALLFSGTPGGLVSWFVNFAYTASAPQGVLDQNTGTISTVIASRVSTPQWEATYRIVTQLFYQGIQQQMADTVAFGQMLAQYRDESARLQQQVVAERQASQDHQAELFRETLGGVQTYNDPVNGALVQLPLGWNTYWVNQRGEYLAVDQSGFDPNTLNDGTWQLLTPRG